MQSAACLLIVCGLSVLLVSSSVSGGIIVKRQAEIALNSSVPQEEENLVYFVTDTNDQTRIVQPDNFTLQAIPENEGGQEQHEEKGFFKQLGCDIAKGSKAITSEVGRWWKQAKKGIKNLFGRKDAEVAEVPATTVEVSGGDVPGTVEVVDLPTEQVPIPVPVSSTVVVPVVTSSSTIEPDDYVDPEIDVRIL